MNHVPQLPKLLVQDAVRAALREDLGRAGDITSQATIAPTARASLSIVAREQGIVAGLDLAEAAFLQFDPAISFKPQVPDTKPVSPGMAVAHVQGCARDVLTAERVALNYLSHLSGIATATSHFVAKIAHTKAKICSTRKTTPGLRVFEKYAVCCGGGASHRYGLDDAVLIKDNHIAVAGNLTKAVHQARDFIGHMVKIEVEVDTLMQLKEALECAPDAILLDNMDAATLKQAVACAQTHCPQIILEASGGITLDTVAQKAETGVDYLSSGWLTQSAPALDFGLDVMLDT